MKLLLYSSSIGVVDFDEIVKPCEGVELIIDDDYPNINPILSLIEYCINNQIGLTIQDDFAIKTYEIVKLENDEE